MERLTQLAAMLAVLILTGCQNQAPPDPPVSETQTAPPAISSRLFSAEPVEEPILSGGGADPVPAAANEVIQPVYRPSDRRPVHDDRRAEQLGINKYVSRRLVLYSDIDGEQAASLPRLMDQACEVWAAYFGDLPPDREGKDFQMTGYLMRERDRFIAAGMLPEDLPDFPHGRHRGAEFWMNEQQWDYYRRHLMVHEGTHCFMTIMPGRRLPLWYLEGMAELFATHELDESGRGTFGVMPGSSEAFLGFGRVQMIQDAVAHNRQLGIDGVVSLGPQAFQASFSEPYAWSWALCRFLESHPRYRERFHKAAWNLDSGNIVNEFAASFAPDVAQLEAEWDLFIRTIDYGYDIERHAIEFIPATPLATQASREFMLSAEKGWQSTGVSLGTGEDCQITCSGRVALGDVPRPWISEPQGITIEYSAGYPIGRVLARIYDPAQRQFSDAVDIGREGTVTSPVQGILFLRINDHVANLRNNTGSYQVTIGRVPD